MKSNVLRFIPKENQWMLVKVDFLTGSGTQSQMMLVDGRRSTELRSGPIKSSLVRTGLKSGRGESVTPDPVDDGIDDIAAEFERLSANDNGVAPDLAEMINKAVEIVEARWHSEGRDLLSRWIY